MNVWILKVWISDSAKIGTQASSDFSAFGFFRHSGFLWHTYIHKTFGFQRVPISDSVWNPNVWTERLPLASKWLATGFLVLFCHSYTESVEGNKLSEVCRYKSVWNPNTNFRISDTFFCLKSNFFVPFEFFIYVSDRKKCLKSKRFNSDYRHCLKSKLSGNGMKLKYLKSKLDRISDIHCN